MLKCLSPQDAGHPHHHFSDHLQSLPAADAAQLYAAYNAQMMQTMLEAESPRPLGLNLPNGAPLPQTQAAYKPHRQQTSKHDLHGISAANTKVQRSRAAHVKAQLHIDGGVAYVRGGDIAATAVRHRQLVMLDRRELPKDDKKHNMCSLPRSDSDTLPQMVTLSNVEKWLTPSLSSTAKPSQSANDETKEQALVVTSKESPKSASPAVTAKQDPQAAALPVVANDLKAAVVEKYIVLRIRKCCRGPPLSPIKISGAAQQHGAVFMDGSHWIPESNRGSFNLCVYLGRLLQFCGRDDIPVLHTVDGRRLVYFQAAVESEMWPEIESIIQPLMKTQQQAYRRYYGGSAAPVIHVEESPRWNDDRKATDDFASEDQHTTQPTLANTEHCTDSEMGAPEVWSATPSLKLDGVWAYTGMVVAATLGASVIRRRLVL